MFKALHLALSISERKQSVRDLHDDQEIEETIQEKRLRLAKDYLTQLEEEGWISISVNNSILIVQ